MPISPPTSSFINKNTLAQQLYYNTCFLTSGQVKVLCNFVWIIKKPCVKYAVCKRFNIWVEMRNIALRLHLQQSYTYCPLEQGSWAQAAAVRANSRGLWFNQEAPSMTCVQLYKRKGDFNRRGTRVDLPSFSKESHCSDVRNDCDSMCVNVQHVLQTKWVFVYISGVNLEQFIGI